MAVSARMVAGALLLAQAHIATAQTNTCERTVSGATQIDFPAYTGSVGQMRGFRVDPANGPSTTVIAALPGGARPVTDLNELALLMAARGVSFVQLAWPGTHSGYTVAQAGANSFSSSTQIALNYLQPVTAYLRANGALRVFGFGWAMGNRFVRIASRVGGIFDGVIIAGAGHTFAGGMNATSSTLDWVKYDVFQQNFFAPENYGVTFVTNQMTRALDECPAANTYVAPIIPSASEAHVSDWIYAGYYPMLVVSGSVDIVAPLALSGNVYQSGSPSTVTLRVLTPAGHFATWENTTFIADAAADWLNGVYPPSMPPLPPPPPGTPGSTSSVADVATLTLTADETVSDYTAFRISLMTSSVATLLGVANSSVTITVSAGSVVITVAVQVPVGQGASAASTLQAATSTPSAASQLLGVNVIAVQPVTTSQVTVIVPAPSSPPSSSNDDDLSGGAIAGIVIGSLCFVAIIGAAVMMLMKKMSGAAYGQQGKVRPEA